MRFGRLVSLLIFSFTATVTSHQCNTRLCRKAALYLRQSVNYKEDPCKNFHSFACGNFQRFHELPDGAVSWDMFDMADNQTTYTIKRILSSPAQPTDSAALKKAKTMYTSCMDADTREGYGLKPLVHIIKKLGGWPLMSEEWSGNVTWELVATVMADYGIPLFLDVSVKAHPDNASQNVIHLNTPKMSMPMPVRKSPWQRETAVDMLAFPDNQENVLSYLVDVAMELRDHMHHRHAPKSKIKQELEQVMDLATKLQGTDYESFILDLCCKKNVTSPISQLSSYGMIDWLNFFQTLFRHSGIGVTSDHVVYTSDWNSIYSILDRFASTDKRVRANYIISRLVMYLAPETTERMRSFLMQLYRQLEIIPGNYSSWQYCIKKVQDDPDIGLSPAVAHEYLNNHFNHKYIQRVHQLIGDIEAALLELLDENTWIDKTSKWLVAKKARAIFVLAGFPQWIANVTMLEMFYDKLKIQENDHFGNVVRMRSYMMASNFALLEKEEDAKLKWSSSPFVVNAFYEPKRNCITLPAGIMQYPFYVGRNNIERITWEKESSKKKNFKNQMKGKCKRGCKKNRRLNRAKESILLALDYGRFGSLVGHEITHGFDDQGYRYSEKGSMGNNWNPHSEIFFDTRSQCFKDQYTKSNFFLPSDWTLGEDISDNGGLRKSYRAFKRAWKRVGGKNVSLPGLPTFTPEQLFFLGYATLWCHTGTEYSLDVHSPHKDRVEKPLANMKEFGAVWNCPLGSPMNPVEKCVLW